MTALGDNQGTSTRPYLLRALHDWCTDNGFTPYIAVYVDDTVQVPREHVKNSEIVLNVGFEATSGLKLGNDAVEFRARFGGVSRDIVVPIDHVVAIYARENGQGMAFPVPTPDGQRQTGPALAATSGAGGGAGVGAGAGAGTPAGANHPPRALRLAGGSDAPESEAAASTAHSQTAAKSADAASKALVDASPLATAAPAAAGAAADDGAAQPLAPPAAAPQPEPGAPDPTPPTPPTPPKGPRPSLKRIK